MTKQEFKEFCAERMIFLDGATGSNLVKAGMPSGICPEQWICEHPDVMLKLQKDYVNSGTDILYAPTFTANRIKLSEYGLYGQMRKMTEKLVQISKEAAACITADDARLEGNVAPDKNGSVMSDGKRTYEIDPSGTVMSSSRSKRDRHVLVAGDLTMTGQQLKPMGTMDLETLIDVYKEQITMLKEAGVDLLVVETMMSLAETRAALIAAKEVCNLPVMVTLTFEKDGRTLYGTDAKTAAIVCESLGAAALGVNCSTGPAKMQPIISDMASVTTVPIIAKPNAGLPFLNEKGETCYDMNAEQFVEEMELLVNAGATIIGGCCGTTPEFIKKLHERFGATASGAVTEEKILADGIKIKGNDWKKKCPVHRRPEGIRYLTSERQTLSFGPDEGFMIVGERINPTGKKLLQAQLRDGNMEKVLQFAEEQEQCGAKVLDINMGMSGIDEKQMMLRAIEEVSGVTNLPLSLDSSYVEVLEAALRNYPGRALVNSVSLETEKFEKLLPLVAKYGAMFILLPLSDAGLPKDLEEKKEIIKKVSERAFELGMRKEDIIVDGLVATVGANKKAGLETLETIRYCKENGFATICGLSNISFGMPERSFVNTAFLTLAIREGLTMAIANPSQELLVSCALATDLLMAKEGADIRYIEYVNEAKEKREAKEAELQFKLDTLQRIKELSEGVTKEKIKGAMQAPVAGAEAIKPGAGGTGAGTPGAGGSFSGIGIAGSGSGSGVGLSGAGVSSSGTDIAGAVAGSSGTGVLSPDAGIAGASGTGGSGSGAGVSIASGSRASISRSGAGVSGQDPAGSGTGGAASTVLSAHGEALRNAVLKGNRNGIAKLTGEAIAAGENPQAILNDVLLPAINTVGEFFDKGKYFLPQLIASAEAMKNSIAVLEPLLLKESSGEDMPVVVIATVEGDIHDIGKNLVALMLKNYGFKVIDLGKDVPAEKIIETAKENHADIIALSALMTTTMQRMREVIAKRNEAKLSAKVMIGGAVITQDYADEIGADGYSKDAADAVKLAKKLVE